MTFTIRIRFKICKNRPIEIKENKIEIPHQGNDQLILQSANENASILTSEELVLQGESYDSEEVAISNGKRYINAISLAFAQLKLSADFQNKSSGSVIISDFWLSEITHKTGFPAYHDKLGLNVIPTGPSFKITMPIPTISTSINKELFINVISKSIRLDPKIDSKKQVAFELYSASITSNYFDSRFLLLMMAIETLISPSPRSEKAIQHINSLIQLTIESTDLSKPEKESLNGSLKWLFNDSISRSGRVLAKTLTGRIYFGMKPPIFFSYCYRLRSNLVHGIVPRPSVKEICDVLNSLESFVADLICYPYLDLDKE